LGEKKGRSRCAESSIFAGNERRGREKRVQGSGVGFLAALREWSWGGRGGSREKGKGERKGVSMNARVQAAQGERRGKEEVGREKGGRAGSSRLLSPLFLRRAREGKGQPWGERGEGRGCTYFDKNYLLPHLTLPVIALSTKKKKDIQKRKGKEGGGEQ